MEDICGFLSDFFGLESLEIEYYVWEISCGGVMFLVDVFDEEDVDMICEVMFDVGVVDLNVLSVEEEESEILVSQEESQIVLVIEEEMEVGKCEVGKGMVCVVLRMVEIFVQEQVSLKEEYVIIECCLVDKLVSLEEFKVMGDKIIEVEEKVEKVVVSKSVWVVEEVEIGKESSESIEMIEDIVCYIEVEVEWEFVEDVKCKGGKKCQWSQVVIC